jgi:hypothetical protein
MKLLPIVALTLLASTALIAAPPQATGGKSVSGPAAEEVKRLVAEGQTAFAKGDYATAKGAFETAYQMDSRNLVAINFLQKIKALEKTAPKFVSQEQQLRGLTVPKVQIKDATIGAVFDYLKSTASKLTGGKAAVNFVLKLPDEVVNTKTISLNMTDAPFTEVVKYVAELANLNVQYQQYAVLVTPRAPVAVPAVPVAPE